ncbi:MAG: TatD family hydrolase [Fibrobacter sp.]|nr:TatD family hydrolase [Fibrobacter sp.]MDY6370174.1 TatD family hydrolase [Fibrobacter sp.]MDY6391098.1 TatD family hydrolase [Fibrobacter sp.]
MLDFHFHLARLPEPFLVGEELQKLGGKGVLIACEPWEWKACIPLLSAFPRTFSPCFGIHPMIAEQVSSQDLEALRDFLQKFPEAFVGECGLDKRFPGYAPGEVQERLFVSQARFALELHRPLMIHMVGDYRRAFSILESLGFPDSSAFPIFHRFGGDKEVIKRGLSLNAIFSIHPDSFRKASTKAILKEIPPENLRIETDADESFPIQNPDGTQKTPSEIAQALLQQLQAVEKKLQSL